MEYESYLGVKLSGSRMNYSLFLPDFLLIKMWELIAPTASNFTKVCHIFVRNQVNGTSINGYSI